MKYEKLSNYYKITSGGTPSRKVSKYYSGGDIPWIKTGDLKQRYIIPKNVNEYITEVGLKNSSAKIFPKDTVLIAMYGATIGNCSILSMDAATNQACAAFIPSKDILPDFLYYFFLSIKELLISKGVGGAQPNISISILKDIEIPIYPISIQEKIVEILNINRDIIEKRIAQIEALSCLKQSVFLEMFGDPSINKYKYNKVKISDLIVSLEAGLSTGGENKIKSDGEYGVLTTSAVTYGVFNPNAYKVPTVDIKDSKRIVHPTKDCILVSRMNTKELVGTSCIVEEDFFDLFIPDRLWKIIMNTEIVNPYYFISAIQQNHFRHQLSKVATGTSGSMLNISQIKFKNLDIILPDIEKQNLYEAISKEISNKKMLLKNSLRQLENNFSSLMQRAFKGELFND